VKAAATELGLPVTHTVEDVAGHDAELGVVVAFGRLIKPLVLARLPMVNVHFSLLPRWRGAAPVERAILAGDAVTGVCLMRVEEGLDTGGVYRREEVEIGPDETADQLRARLADVGAKLLVDELAHGLVDRMDQAEPQVGEPTYAAKIEPAELHLDWSRPAVELHRVVRLGRAWTTWKGKRLLVLEARPVAAPTTGEPGSLDGDLIATGAGSLQLVRVQPEGKGALSADAWRRGARPGPADRLGS
jgi:methionyl-tRNA formyltransferase